MLVDPPQELTAAEAAVLALMLSADLPDAVALREQLRSMKVVGRCDCGCPTINLAVDPDVPLADDLGEGPLEVDGVIASTPDYTGYQIIVFTRAGRLASLELSYYDQPPTAWSPVTHITAQ